MADKHPLTLDDIFALQDLRDAQISPDGTQVAFVVAREYTEGERKLPESSIWLVAADGASPARRFTHGPRADEHPRWSPDGRTLAFLSDRAQADVLQLYTLPLGGGEAHRLTEAKCGVTNFAWSPDGAQIAYLATDPASEEEERRQQERDDAIHIDHDYKFNRLWVVDAGGGTARAITPPAYQVQGFAWYGDGWAALTSPTPLADDFVGWSLVRLSEDRPAETILKLRHGTYGLAGSRDGRALAWTHSGADADESVDELWALLPGGTPQRVAADYAGGIAWASWLPDGEALLVTAIDGTRTSLGRVSKAGGEVTTLMTGKTLAERFFAQPQASVSDDGRRIACLIEDGEQPAEVWAGETGGDLRQLTAFNQHLGTVALGAVETLHWQAPDGLPIDGVLVYPSGYVAGRRYPLIVHIHGGPSWQWLHRFLANWHDWDQWLAAHGYAVLLPNPRGSTGRGREFLYANRRAWGSGDLGDLLSGVDHLIDMGLADPERLGIGGWSYGGFLTSWAIGHSNRFKAAVVGAGVTNLLSFQAADIPSWLPRDHMLANPYQEPETYLRSSPISYAANITTPTLILHGQNDERVRLGQGRELYHALRSLDVPAEMVVYPRETHLIAERHHQHDMLTRIVGWFDRWLMNAEK